MTRSPILAALAVALAGCPPKDPENRFPVAEDRAVTTPEDTPVQIALVATDPDGDPLQFRIDALPENGTLEVVGPNATYTPDPEYSGTDAFTFVANDGAADSNTATVTITVEAVNDPPTIADGDLWGFAGRYVYLDLVAADPEGDDVTITWTQTAGLPLTVEDAPEGARVWPVAAGVYTFTAAASDGADTTTTSVDLRIMDLAGGDEHTLAVRPDGTVWAWGDNRDNQVGDGTGEDWSFPVPVCAIPGADGPPCDTVLDGAVRVGAGEDWSMAVLANGTVWGWGRNSGGQLGGCTVAADCSANELPRPINGLSDVVEVTGGPGFGVALKADGTVWTWGANTYGQLGQGWVDDKDDDDPTRIISGVGQVCRTWDPVEEECTAYLDGIVAIRAGRDRGSLAAALDDQGHVWMWGDGDDGALGDGCEETDDCGPTPVAGQVCALWDEGTNACSAPLDDVDDVVVGESWALALLGTGTVVGWGNNFEGQLGNGCDAEGGQCVDQDFPVAVCGEAEIAPCASNLGRVRALAAGEDHALAVVPRGRVLAWGENFSGQLGNGCSDAIECGFDIGTPRTVCDVGDERPCTTELLGAVGVRAGGDTSYALLADGTLLGWGQNDDGTAGDASAFAPFAIPVDDDPTWVAVEAGREHSLGLKSDGTLWAWGSNDDLALGNACNGLPDTCPPSFGPTQVLSPSGSGFDTDWIGIAIGEAHSVALKSSGVAYGFGSDRFSAIGGGGDSDIPVAIPGGPWQTLAAGDQFTVAIATDGSLWGWGWGSDGQLADGDETTSGTPLQAVGADGGAPDTDWTQLAAGTDFALGIKADGTLWGWGEGGDGQLGNAADEDSPFPVAVRGPEGSPPPSDWLAVSAGDEFAVGLRSPGSLWAWGAGDDGQLGNGCFDLADCPDFTTPIPVRAPDGGMFESDWALVDAGWYHVVAAKTDGTVWAWGDDDDGSLGTALLRDEDLPTPVCAAFDAVSWTCTEQLTGVVAISAGEEHTLVIRDDGTLWGWGGNRYGQLGTGGGEDVAIPSVVRW